MNIVLTFSPTNQSLKVAQYFAKQLSWDLYDLTSYDNQNNFDYQKEFEYVVFSFPIHSQLISIPVQEILKKVNGKYFILLGTYGKMGTGDVLNDAKRLIKGIVIGAALIPSKHTYKDNLEFIDYQELHELVLRVSKSEEIMIPKRKRNVFAKFYPNLRSRLNVKLNFNYRCIQCKQCELICPTKAIKNFKFNNKCIRCLRCFNNCPIKGIDVHYSLFLKMYLKKNKENRLIIY